MVDETIAKARIGANPATRAGRRSAPRSDENRAERCSGSDGKHTQWPEPGERAIRGGLKLVTPEPLREPRAPTRVPRPRRDPRERLVRGAHRGREERDDKARRDQPPCRRLPGEAPAESGEDEQESCAWHRSACRSLMAACAETHADDPCAATATVKRSETIRPARASRHAVRFSVTAPAESGYHDQEPDDRIEASVGAYRARKVEELEDVSVERAEHGEMGHTWTHSVSTPPSCLVRTEGVCHVPDSSAGSADGAREREPAQTP